MRLGHASWGQPRTAAIANASQPKINSSPPAGTIAQWTAVPANTIKYSPPENPATPAVNKLAATFNHRDGWRVASVATPTNARA